MKAYILLILTFCFVRCTTQKENLIGIWKTENGKEKLFIHKLYDDLIIDYSTEVMGHSVIVFSTEATFNDNVLTLKNTFFGNRTWPHTILCKGNHLIYQNKTFKINDELTSTYLQSLKEQEEKEKKDKLNNLAAAPFIVNIENANVGKISQLLKFKSHDELTAAFGSKVQRLFTAMIGKTEIPFGSVLYRDEVNQVIFLWKDNTFTDLHALFITPKAQGNNYVIPDWEFEGGIKVGMSAAELVELNDKKIDFMGLGNFNKSGMVLSFNDGKLSNYNIYPEIETTGNPPVSVYNNFSGYKRITSDDKYFDKLDLKIRSIWVLNSNQERLSNPTIVTGTTPSTFLEDYLKYNSHEDLIDALGTDNVDKKELTDNGGEMQYSSVIFSNTDKQLEFIWKSSDYAGLKSISDDMGNGEYAKPAPSFYSTHQGLKIKLSLDALCDLNKKPITFYGFEWDNGGAVINWSNGALNASKVDVTLGYSGDIPYSKASTLTGDVQLKSDSREVKQSGINIFIKEISIYPK